MKNIFDKIFIRDEHVCPWWCCFTFDNPIRRLFQNPYQLLSPYVDDGSTVMDIGPGMGYFTIPLCKLVGKKGRVIAIDIQERMLVELRNRASRVGITDNLITHLSKPTEFGINEKADFILAFWMIHEVPDQTQFFTNVKMLMNSEARFLIAEPLIHVTSKMFNLTLEKATGVGLKLKETPKISFSRTALFTLE
jgi:tRNA A58 N-methylase Trm61